MPLLDRPAILLAALLYCAATLAIGFWAARRTKTARDFYIAGQGIGLLVTTMAMMASAFSGFVFLGGPGLMYRLGVASLLINVPVSFTGALLCWSVGRRLRLLAASRELFTVPDVIAARYRRPGVTALAALAVTVGTVGYLGAQVLALGVVIEALFGTRAALGAASAPVAMAAGLLVIVVYCVAGGMVAGVYTDLFQGAVMLVAALAVFAQALAVGGGLEAMTRAIVASPAFGPGFLDPFGRVPLWTGLGFFFVFGIGVLGQPHMLHKFFMLDDIRKLRWFPLTLALAQSVCLLIWFGIGLVVPALVAQGRLQPLVRADDAAPAFLLQFAPGALAGLVFAGVLAAIMSTASSLLNLGAAALVRDLPRALGRPFADELRWGRAATIGIAVAALLLAWGYGDLIALLGTFAFGTFAAALAPALAIGLNWRRVTPAAAGASIATGLVANLLLELLHRRGLFSGPFSVGVLPSAVALALSFAVLFVVSLASRDPQPLDADVAAAMEA
jgi:Na+/proline symporter